MPLSDAAESVGFKYVFDAESLLRRNLLKVATSTYWDGRALVLQILYDRLSLFQQLLTEDSSIYPHVEPDIVSYVDVFGSVNRRGNS